MNPVSVVLVNESVSDKSLCNNLLLYHVPPVGLTNGFPL